VGTTAISTNLGVAMAKASPGRVVLVDLARPFPNVGQFLDIRSTHTIMDLVENADNLDPVFLGKTVQQHDSQLSVLLGYGGLSLNSHPLLEPAVLEKIFHALRASYDWILVDLGHWLDSLYLKVVEDADMILLITELSVPDLQNLKKVSTYFKHWNITEEKIRIVVNRYAKSFTLGLGDLESIFPRAAVTTFPSDYSNLIEGINQGAALPQVAPRSKLWRQIEQLADEIIATSHSTGSGQTGERPGWLRRLFGAKG
jgi:pilus assembly protein CpaE